ncbi:MAG: DUF998 domain-containing protein [Methanomassiliicoccales archaeon]|nr:DUF998 domain-containing protein [Methanomassiliicoccales archaeon]
MKRRMLAGTLLFVAGAQFLLFLIIAETQYPGYSANENYISDLGVWEEWSAVFFNVSVIAFGLLGLIGGFILREDKGMSYVPWLLIVSGAGAIILGIFPETVWGLHKIGAFMAFICASSAAVCCFKAFSGPFRYIATFLGVLSFITMILSITNIFLGLGPGGMERMILYPIIIWMTSLGTVLYSSAESPEG